MPAPRRPRLQHVSVKLKVTVDPAEYAATYVVDQAREDIAEHIRQMCVHRLRELPAIHSVRRDGA